MANPRLVIPERDRKAIARIVKLSPEELRGLLDALRLSEPALDVQTTIAEVHRKTKMSEEVVTDAVRVLYNLFFVRERLGRSLDQLSEEFFELIKDIDEVSDATTEQLDAVENFVTEGLKLQDNLGVSAKAMRIMTQHQHVYMLSELYTDIRTVFAHGDIEKSPHAAVLVHNLKISYNESGERKNFFVAMDRADLQELLQILQRALKKHDKLRMVLQEAELHCLDPEEKS